MNSEKLHHACKLDAAGVIPGRNESADEFFRRAQNIFDVQRQLANSLALDGRTQIFDGIGISNECKVEDSFLAGARELTWKLYAFKVEHIPGFFLSGSVGLLWGGCMISDPDIDLAVFFLRSAFKNKEKWLFYSRTELGAHELCHSARTAINDPELEEYFAYATSSSKLRRYLGNCFIRDIDALFFIIPVLLLPVAQFLQLMFFPRMWIFPFWLAAFAYPCYLLLRNAASRKKVNRARRVLQKCGVQSAEAVLFRSTADELKEIGSFNTKEQLISYINSKAADELRWQVISERFIKCEDVQENG